MNSRTRLAAAALTATVLGALAACSSSDGTPAKPSASADATARVKSTATTYLRAWMAVTPSDGRTMCTLETAAARPNFDDDGGTLKGCIARRQQDSAADTADPSSTRAPLSITVSNVQDVPASHTHPAGKGVLATLHRSGDKPFRYALRLVKDGDAWRIEQKTDVGDRYAHTADPVAAVLAQME
ncbi:MULTISPECIES: hypothetical protein [Streptomyces]|uniref:Lipoprotein n=1 Tax=Streptomyces sp. F12 TaxID=1436084 RepID=V9Z7T6_9ACTN|nr:hypothetical protein [Streptomyces sp. F12]AHE40183.1 Hypothetical protein pFRL6_96 [Streptomyces sp. F12]